MPNDREDEALSHWRKAIREKIGARADVLRASIRLAKRAPLAGGVPSFRP
jgi:hypothetical protein